MSRSEVGKTRFWIYCVLLAFLVCALGIRFCADKLRFWLPLINGATWPDDWKNEYAEFPMLFSFVLALRFLLNISPVFVVILLVWELFVSRTERVMKVLDLLKLRDGMAANQVIQELGLDEAGERKVIEAMDRAGKRWAESHLPTLIGKNEATDLINHTYSGN